MTVRLKLNLLLAISLLYAVPAVAATSMPFTVVFSEPVVVSGCPSNCPRLVLDVGGATRYAPYSAGSGTTSLTFTYTAQVGDIDLNGITISSTSVDLNTSGSIKDLSGNDLSPATFTPPTTSGLKVDYPSLMMDFIAGDYILNGTHYASLSAFLSAAGGSFSRASVATYYNAAGLLQTASSNVARFDYDPLTHTAKGLLTEESRTNELIYSEQINTGWTLQNSTLSVNAATAPDGNTTAELWTRNSTASSYLGRGATKTATAITYSGSFFVKQNVGDFFALRMQGAYPSRADIIFNLSTGTISSAALATSSFTGASGAIQSVGNGWYRVSLTATTDTNTSVTLYGSFNTGGGVLDAIDSASNSSGYVWGGQLEQGAFATSYIPTTNLAVTRALDAVSIPIGSWYTAAQGSLYGEAQMAANNTLKEQAIADLDAGSGNQILMWKNKTGQQMELMPRVTFTPQTNSLHASSAIALNTTYKVAAALKTNDFATAFNGTELTTSSTGTLITPTSLYVGSVLGTVGSLNGTVRLVKYYPARIANAQLQLLTQ